MSNPIQIHVLSDSSGETAAHVTQAALAQFPKEAVRIFRHPRVRSPEQIGEIISEAAKTPPALIVHTLALPELRESVSIAGKRFAVPSIDLIGDLIYSVSDLSGISPLEETGRLHQLDDEYYRRIEAVNFAVSQDDGVNPDRVREADVVLIGVSRTSKTPSSMYLAQHYGLKAANIPLVVGIEPPAVLNEIEKRKLFGLTVDPKVLHSLRTTRAKMMGMPDKANYTEMEAIAAEVDYARRIFRKLGCRVIDVSRRAVEETASEIAHLLS